MKNWSSFQQGSTAMDFQTAQKWLDQVTVTCNTLNPELILAFFTEDVVADLGAVVVTGKAQLAPLIRARYANYTRYDLQKTVRAVAGDLVVCEARLRWTSADEPELQHTRAIEILQVRSGRIARWDNASTSWPAGAA